MYVIQVIKSIANVMTTKTSITKVELLLKTLFAFFEVHELTDIFLNQSGSKFQTTNLRKSC